MAVKHIVVSESLHKRLKAYCQKHGLKLGAYVDATLVAALGKEGKK